VTDGIVNPNGDQGQTSLGLLQRARAREPGAWARLADLYEPLVDHWCRRAGLQPADGADVRQEVFLAVASHLGEFRAAAEGGTTFRGWLRVITANKIRDHWRRGDPVPGAGGDEAQRRLESVPDAGPLDSDPGALAEESGLLYRRALELVAREFGDRTWRAFWRLVIAGKAAADVAAELGTTTNAVYLAKSRVLARLREEFTGLLEG
jgi:RNA polymerase sigma-70 factor (ECF subfamily)